MPKIKEEKVYLDIPAPEHYLKSHMDSMEIKERLFCFPYFQGNQNHDFYLGMIAGLRAALSFHTADHSIKQYEDLLTDCNIMATILVIEKKNP